MSESPKNIKILIGELRNLNGRILLNNERLFIECREVFQKLQTLKLAKTSDLELDHIEKSIKVLEGLPAEIKQLDIKELGVEAKEPESKALNQNDLEKLLDDYEKAGKEEKTKIEEKITKSGNKKNVEKFLETQKRILDLRNEKTELSDEKLEIKKTVRELVEDYKKAGPDKKKEIERELYVKTGVKDAEKYIKKSEEVVSKNIYELEKLETILREKVTEDLIKISENQPEAIVKIIEGASLTEKFNKKEIEKEIKKSIKNSEGVEEIVQKIEEVRAEILVESKAEEIAQKTLEKLKTENIPVRETVKTELKEAILKSWEEGDGVEIPEQLMGKERGEVIVREVVRAAEIFKADNLESVVNYRAEELGKEIGSELRQKGVDNEILIEEYISVVNKLTNNPETIITETNRGEVANFVQSRNQKIGAGEMERSIDEAQFMAKNVVMAPKKFNRLIGRYNQLREGIGAEKLPNLKEIRVTEKMAAIFKNSPQMLRLMNGAQRMVKIWEKVNAFPANIMGKTGGRVVEKFGGKILGKIGGQAAVEFVKQASLVIAKEGTIQGIKSITLGIMGKGAVVAGSGAAGGGALAGAVAAFQALPVVGQIILVAVAAVVLLKGVVDKVKGVVGKITGLNMNGVKNFLSDTLGLGKVVGGVGQFVVDVGTFLVGIPALIGLISFTAIITPVVIFFFLGTFTYSLLQQNLLSSLVPPAQTGGGEEVAPVTPWPSGAPVPEGCPNMRPAAGYFTQGPFASGCSHVNMSVPAVDIGAGNGTPIVATHPGVVFLGYDSIYGYYIDIHGRCGGKEFYTRYAHMPLGGYRVKNNTVVVAGQQIGVVDNTGSSTGPHLHYHIVGLDTSRFGQYLGLSFDQTLKLWGCCGPPWNNKPCP